MKTVRKKIKSFNVEIKDAKTGAVLKSYSSLTNQSKEKIAIDYIKSTGKTTIDIEVTEKNEVREMPFDFFMANSTEVVKTPIQAETKEEVVNE